jgi:flagellar biogenesis protein FliO
MSPLAKLLQIQPAQKLQRESILGKIWANFLGILRATKIQRRVRRLEIVERITLGNKQSVVLMRMDDREFMVGCCGDSVVLLAPPQSPTMPADAMKVQVKRRKRIRTTKAKTTQPVLAAPVPVVAGPFAADDAPVKVSQSAKKAKAAPQIEAPLKQRVPTKARLVKAFAGRV